MGEEPTEVIIKTLREPDYDFLDPSKVFLFRDDSGRLRLTIEEDRSYLEAKVVRAFPLSDPDHYFAFLMGNDKVIGIVADAAELKPESRQLACDEVGRRYFSPRIKRIYSLKEEYGAFYFDVDTESGKREFVVKGIRDAVVDLGNGEVLIMDVDGNRYKISNWNDMDDKSRRLLEQVI
jgi:hypothetical protein